MNSGDLGTNSAVLSGVRQLIATQRKQVIGT
jgi:hypothetical protein